MADAPADASRFAAGLEVLEGVPGARYAERARAGAADPFVEPFTRAATEMVWGGAWSRDDLDRRTRSLLTLALLIALSRPGEIALHVRGALANGATREEIRAVLLHAMPYCGVPAALDALRAVVGALRGLDAEAAPRGD
jgi:4-carboxymuconolactone decarboxylase